MDHWIETTGTLDLWQIGVANLLLAGSITSLAVALWSAFSHWRANKALGVVCAVVGLAFVFRILLAPKLMATIFIGYKATQQAIDLFPLPHYGAGTTVLYHHLLTLFGQDHLVIMWSNALIGIVTLPLVMLFAEKMVQSNRVGWVVGLLVAAAPILIRNDASDANNVPCLLWMFCGLTLYLRALFERNRWFLWWACFPLALAVVSRPEMVVLVGGLVIATVVASPVARERRRLLGDALFFAPFAALIIPHLVHIWRAAKALQQGDNIDSLASMLILQDNALFEVTLFGGGYLLAAFVGTVILRKSHRRWLICMWTMIVVSLVLYNVDLDRANLARAHVPAALLVTILAGQALVEIHRRKGSIVVMLLIGALVLGSNIPPWLTLWQPTNEQTEETLVREALESIDAPEFTLIRLNNPDLDRAEAKGRGHTHYHFPDYLFQNEERRGRVVPLSAWLERDPESDTGPAYFFRGVRCFAEFRWEDEPAPIGDNENPLCKAMLNLPDVQPVFVHQVTNYGNPWINYYGTSERLTVGLYRMR